MAQYHRSCPTARKMTTKALCVWAPGDKPAEWSVAAVVDTDDAKDQPVLLQAAAAIARSYAGSAAVTFLL